MGLTFKLTVEAGIKWVTDCIDYILKLKLALAKTIVILNEGNVPPHCSQGARTKDPHRYERKF